ncbi:hypothetical protein BDN70DRAFT_710467 [Pholiota conissans]|uniref:F-box domain-containing protein n=1 Tax=Pholiota conissans TaxID=109636 RepID=A0A9P6CTB1_9AGAR|nr:hypothetical protein BDN70DRAFT_710467 [Pholiota conissans]
MNTPSFSVFDSFPNELISTIHEEAVLTYSEASTTPTRLDRTTLASISLVCKKWRQNSLNNGKLWAPAVDVNCGTLAWVEEVLRRAKSYPIAIVSSKGKSYREPGDFLHKFTFDSWQRVFEKIAFWGVFSLETALLNDKSNLAALMDGLRNPAPKLESFTLVNTYSPWPYDWDTEDEHFMLPGDFLGRHAPRLKMFDVHHILLPASFDFSVWNNLTSLKVSQDMTVMNYDVMKWTTRNWLDILRPLKFLEHLELADVYDTSNTNIVLGFGSTPNVHLDHLSSLKLTRNFRQKLMFDLLARLIIPSACKISITVHQWAALNEYTPHEFHNLKCGLDRHIRGLLTSNGNNSLSVSLRNSFRGIGFDLAIWLHDRNNPSKSLNPSDSPNFLFCHSIAWVDNAVDVDINETRTLEDIPSAPTPDYPFSQLLAALEDLPASDITIQSWPRIVINDVEPLCRFLSRCEHADVINIYDTDGVILDILQRKQSMRHGILIPNLSSFHYEAESEEDLRRLEEFRFWRESIGKLPEQFEP